MVLGSGGARGAPLIVQVERGKAADSKGRQAIPQSVHARLGIFCIQLRGINVVIKVHRQRRASVPCAVEIDQPISPGHAGNAVVQPCGMRGRGGGHMLGYATSGYAGERYAGMTGEQA
jgi:hypothetical protein